MQIDNIRRTIGYGLLISTVILTPISGIALATLFAPPFFATALFAKSAIWLCPLSAGVAFITFIAGRYLLQKKYDESSLKTSTKTLDFPLENPTQFELDSFKDVLSMISNELESRAGDKNGNCLSLEKSGSNRNHVGSTCISETLCDALVKNGIIHSWNMIRASNVVVRLSAEDKLDST